MNGRLKTYAIIWLIVLSIISITSLCRTFYRNIDLTVDYIGIIVGILAILCTVLIGWQIYVLVDVRRINERFEAIEAKRNNDNLRTALQIYESVSTLTEQMATNATKEELLPQSIMFELLCIVTQSKLEEFDVCNYQIANLIGTPPKGIHVRAFDRNQYIRIISEMNRPDKITEYPALITWISSLSVRPNP